MYNCIILAAGDSKRMGKLKPFLSYDKDLTFLEYLLKTYIAFGVKNPVVVTSEIVLLQIRKERRPAYEKCQFVLNSSPEKGRYYSLKLGLQHCQTPKPVFIQNVDNPFIDKKLLEDMVRALVDDHYVVPCYHKKNGHPILLSSLLAGILLNEFPEDSVLSDVLRLFSRRSLEVNDPNILLNINTPEEYQNFIESVDNIKIE